MSKSMLIDAAHSEETRVVVVGANGLEEFDFESASLRTLKGNIYLAKVTRVEPSLQAAFVTYGGNRHGFLPFNEIHPDYYRIPVADREALAAEVAADREDHVDEDEDEVPPPNDDENDNVEIDEGESGADEASGDEASEAAADKGEPAAADDAAAPADADAASENGADEASSTRAEDDAEAEADDDADGDADAESGDAADDRPRQRPRRRAQPRRVYKIQEVVKRGQIMLVQVAKEERGGKGAAMTTFISLAGRYCVLMPNTGKGGGISRKITDAKDRKRLKDMIDDLELPDGMAVIVRTAGVERTKAEIKRDHEFLLRLWDEIRERTLASTAPALIYEEASLIKRAIRDIYARDIDEVLVEGDGAYREAKDFMRSLMPSHAKRVQPYKESTPLFQARGVEARLESLFDPIVRLPSGGYLVINQTEALVAIDVNSGRSTRERNIEETALKTNMEAAVEAARQLRLRELAGIVIIDFIDMDERRNNASVERKLKDALKADRARVHVGRMSPLGLIEMSRQRMRPSMFETSFHECPMCAGLGRVRSVESNALGLLRVAEERAMESGQGVDIRVTAATDAIVYLLNNKRDAVARIEESYGVRIVFARDDDMVAHERSAEIVGRGEDAPAFQPEPRSEPRPEPRREPRREPREPREIEEEPKEEAGREERGRRQGRGARRGRGRAAETEAPLAEDSQSEERAPAAPAEAQDESDEEGARRRRRGRRGGRRRGRGQDGEDQVENQVESQTEDRDEPQSEELTEGQTAEAANENGETPESAEKSGRRRRRRRGGRRGAGADQVEAAAEQSADAGVEADETQPTDGASMSDAAMDPDAPEPEVQVEVQNEAEPAAEPEVEPVAERAAPAVEAASEPVVEAEAEAEIAAPEAPAEAAAPEPEAAVEAPGVEAIAPTPEPEAEAEPSGPPRRGWWRRSDA